MTFKSWPQGLFLKKHLIKIVEAIFFNRCRLFNVLKNNFSDKYVFRKLLVLDTEGPKNDISNENSKSIALRSQIILFSKTLDGKNENQSVSAEAGFAELLAR